jgi:hypothetical protein
MSVPRSTCVIRFVTLLLVLVGQQLFADENRYSREIQPLLAKRCFACHGPAEQEAGLALHDRTLATAKTDSDEFAIVPGDPKASILIDRVSSSDDSLRMPPEGEPLTAAEIELLTNWIADGAEYQPHWSFVGPERPVVPDIAGTTRALNPIDHFVLARLDAINMKSAPPADRSILIRRLYLDLIGLLPSIEETTAFVNGDISFSEVVDQLLDSPHFGERWGRHWLDLARYADSFGYERDDVRPNAWRYRDWVIQSFNTNQPYDAFLVEQLAGDLLDEPSLGQRIATGLHRMNIKNNEAGINKEDYRNREMVDRVNTTSTSMLGLTLGCCQCHSHKYDPFSLTDYYQLYAFFNNIETKDEDIEGSAADQARHEKAMNELETHRTVLKERQKLLGELRKFGSFAEWHSKHPGTTDQLVSVLDLPADLANALKQPSKHSDLLTELWASLPVRHDDTGQALRQLSVQQRHLPKPYIMTLAEASVDRRETYVLTRGDFKAKGEVVQPATPSALPPLTARSETPDRLDLAHWIVDPGNPLTARVAVNHIWAHLFGRGIVTTLDDFGTQGTPPTHPLLLDWLAVEFMESGWDRKHLIRTIVHSATWQQSSATSMSDIPEHQQALDSSNPLFARQVRFRVESEIVRDLFLHASGLLHPELGGPTIHPVLPAAVSDLGYKYKTRWIVSEKPHRYRRGLYIHFKRTNPYPSLLMFDGPESNVCQAMRNRSNTPLQALATLNDPVFVECAQALGRSLALRTDTTIERLMWVGRQCLCRELTDQEIGVLEDLFQSEARWYRENPQDAATFVGDYSADQIDDADTAAWIAVARTVLNLDEFVTRE